jgi:tetratricopeptide (TPR) repeat protein
VIVLSSIERGVILLELRFFEEGLSLFKQSQDLLGRSAATSYNLGLCSLGLRRPSEAFAFMIEACDLDPAFEPARLMRRKLEDEQAANEFHSLKAVNPLDE